MASLFQGIRAQSAKLCEPLEIEDYGVQPMDDASPPKWHLAHTTWFFETFVLKPYATGYNPFHPQFEHLFNSYYNGVGTPFPRPSRGFLSRPTVAEVLDYRAHVEAGVMALLAGGDSEIERRVVLGCHHEQQHQELLLTDLKFNFGHNPLYPAYCPTSARLAAVDVPAMGFVEQAGGIYDIGVDADSAGASGDSSDAIAFDRFSFDNEGPQHQVLMSDFALADRLVTNAEFLEFIEDGGYERADLWLAEGWTRLAEQNWQCPEYWVRQGAEWFEYRLDGLHPLAPHLPVVHVSAHEAFAYANWAGLRLPTEFEFEVATNMPVGESGGFQECEAYHPGPAGDNVQGVKQAYGQVWQWTSSAYAPYPGFTPLPGTLGEYNGKFMSSQLVLRGASVATPQAHARRTYRNFFYPPDRWQFSGIRLAKSI